MPYTPEEIQAALAHYRQSAPLSNPEGTWAAPNTAPMPTVPGPVDTTALSPEAPNNPDWMAVARSYGQPAPAAPDQTLAALPPPSTPQESLAAIRDTSSRAAQAERARGESQAQSFEREALLADEQLSDLKEQELAQAEQRRIRNQKYETLFTEAQKRSDEAANMSVYDRRTTGQVVSGAIGLALAAVGDGFNRMGGNTQTNAIGMISSQLDRQLERDLQLQREAIEDKRKVAAAKMTELGIARQMNVDAEGQDELARVFLLRKQATAMKSLAANTQAADARALAEQGAAERESKAATLYDAILDRNANTQANTEYKEGLVRAQRANAAGGGGAQYSVQDILTMGDSNQPMNPKLRAEYARLKALRDREGEAGLRGENAKAASSQVGYEQTQPPGFYTTDKVKRATDIITNTSTLQHSLGQMRGLMEQMGTTKDEGEFRRLIGRYNNLRRATINNMSQGEGQGVIVPGEASIWDGRLPEAPENVAKGTLSEMKSWWTSQPTQDPRFFTELSNDYREKADAGLVPLGYSASKAAPQQWPGNAGQQPRQAAPSAPQAQSSEPKPFKVYGTPRK